MADIRVERADDDRFEVTLSEGGSSSTHVVTVDLGKDGVSAEHLVESSLRFLLDREPKESILAKFALSEIQQYFPEYHDRIGDYL